MQFNETNLSSTEQKVKKKIKKGGYKTALETCSFVYLVIIAQILRLKLFKGLINPWCQKTLIPFDVDEKLRPCLLDEILTSITKYVKSNEWIWRILPEKS